MDATFNSVGQVLLGKPFYVAGTASDTFTPAPRRYRLRQSQQAACDPHLSADEADRDRVVGLSHDVPAVPADLRVQCQAALEVLVRERDQVVAAKASAFLLDATLLVRPCQAREAVVGVEPDLPWVRDDESAAVAPRPRSLEY